MDGTLQSPLISLPTPHFGTEGLYLRKQSVAPFNYSSEPNAHPSDKSLKGVPFVKKCNAHFYGATTLPFRTTA